MSLKPSGQNKLLTVEQVIDVRKRFFESNESYFVIEDETGIKYSQLRKAIHGRGKFYASIEDGIPEETKKSRVRYNEYRTKSKIYGNKLREGFSHEEAMRAAGLTDEDFRYV